MYYNCNNFDILWYYQFIMGKLLNHIYDPKTTTKHLIYELQINDLQKEAFAKHSGFSLKSTLLCQGKV